ncbi:MAG TPA: phage major capsid protein, partial [Galbitalea sp.]
MADITRAEVASLIAEEYAGTVFDGATEGSAALQAFPHYNMGTKTTNIPVLATLPEAAWVTDVDNSGVKSTAQVTWADKTLVAEEIAVIIPIHENTLDDATEDVLAQIAAQGGQAIGKALDQAVFFGTNKPVSWTSSDLLAAAVAASQTYTVNPTAGADDLYGSINQASEGLDDAGFDPMSLIARGGLRFKLSNLRGSDGHLLLNGASFNGLDTTWVRNGSWDSDSATAFVVDPAKVRIGVRQDITVKFLDQATITGVGNLAEKDMVALRFKARFAYVLGSGATSEGASKVPVA